MKMRHVSCFRLRPEARTPENLDRLENALRALPGELPAVTACEIGRKPFPMPAGSPDGKVDFYDLIQILTFDSEEDCMSYPRSAAHASFLALSDAYMEKVIGIDYPLE